MNFENIKPTLMGLFLFVLFTILSFSVSSWFFIPATMLLLCTMFETRPLPGFSLINIGYHRCPQCRFFFLEVCNFIMRWKF
ncbi:MAG: hypothetical protein K2X48_03885 [Chitinophagaceae bacterium]|nr:hypothetical protein [Chitinophagaceae bacterium]